jgi:hypothetical protein
MGILGSFYVVPGHTFFYWGFTIPKKFYDDYIDFLKLDEGNLKKDIVLIIDGKRYSAKIRMARINNTAVFAGRSANKWRERNVIQVFYDREYETLKALRFQFTYSYASTIDKKNNPKQKEILEFQHIKDHTFKIKPITSLKSDFDEMFRYMEEKNLFRFWKDRNKKKNETIILDYARTWLGVDDLARFKFRSNIIYLLYHSLEDQIYVGKANVFGKRIKKDRGRVGLKNNWDKFIWFEINPAYNQFIEELEHFLIRTFASIMKNSLNIEPVVDNAIELVNRQLKKHKI